MQYLRTNKIFILALISVITSGVTFAGSKLISNLNFQPTAIVKGSKETFVVKDSTIFTLSKNNTLEPAIKGANSYNAVAVIGNELWAATPNGIIVYSATKPYNEQKRLLNGKRIATIVTDQRGRVWAASSLEGAYMQEGKDSFNLKINAIGTYSIQCTKDSNVWVGTSIGLFKIDERSLKYTRYAEEGHSGHELPDNLVEKLYKDEESNIWVIMPDNISFKSSKHYTGEIPSYAYIGDKENSIKNIISLPKASYLFVTEKGLSFLPSSELSEHNHNHGSEIFASQNTQAYTIKKALLNTPKTLTDEPILYAEKTGQNIYFITAKGSWSVDEKLLMKKLGAPQKHH